MNKKIIKERDTKLMRLIDNLMYKFIDHYGIFFSDLTYNKTRVTIKDTMAQSKLSSKCLYIINFLDEVFKSNSEIKQYVIDEQMSKSINNTVGGIIEKDDELESFINNICKFMHLKFLDYSNEIKIKYDSKLLNLINTFDKEYPEKSKDLKEQQNRYREILIIECRMSITEFNAFLCKNLKYSFIEYMKTYDIYYGVKWNKMNEINIKYL